MTISLTDRPPDRPRADGRDGEQCDEVLARRGGHPAPLDAQSTRAESTVFSPLVVEDTPPVVEDGVIADARQRARRRRAGYGIVAAVSALLLGAGAIVMLGGPSDARRSTVDPEDGGAALPAAPVDQAEVVAEWVQFHAGWAYVFDDGRVLWRTDGGHIIQQRLNPEGLDLVREGEIDPVFFVVAQVRFLPPPGRSRCRSSTGRRATRSVRRTRSRVENSASRPIRSNRDSRWA